MGTIAKIIGKIPKKIDKIAEFWKRMEPRPKAHAVRAPIIGLWSVKSLRKI